VRRVSLLLAAVLLGAAFDTNAALRGVAGVEHVALISIDGLRPDLALRASMPNLRSLMAAGAFSFWAKTTAVSVTLPSHTSMLTGVTPDKHGIVWNSDLPFTRTVYPSYPTVLELATSAGWVTAMAAGKSKFATLNKPGTISHVFVPAAPDSSVDDEVVADHAVAMLAQFKPVILFVHFPGVDRWGHEKGWGSDEQIAAIGRADVQLGRILAALDSAGLRATTAILISADHGGAGRNHGPDDARSRHIPWILSGPGVRRNFDLTRIENLEIRTEDTAATVCYLLGLTPASAIDGKPVLAALQ
jgi:predicted AlkP superfamily pyrophosphatase or phosphodiesterase